MGVSKLPLFLKSLDCKTSTSTSIPDFDCLLIDIQSVIYSKLLESFKENEDAIISDTCEQTFSWFIKLLEILFSKTTNASSSTTTIVICFDGAGVPMKWPVQKKRRTAQAPTGIKDVLRMSIFECNTISQKVYKYFKKELSRNDIASELLIKLPNEVRFLLSSSKIPNEGEHKLFEIASKLGYKRPLIFSVDNDVFVIALVRCRQFDNVFIGKSIIEKKFEIYELREFFPRAKAIAFLSFLFGNDFIPEIIGITDTNVEAYKNFFETSRSDYSLIGLLYDAVQYMISENKIRFCPVDYYEDRLLVEFWKNCLWVMDYYERSVFPQRYMQNYFYTAFDRNQFLTAFQDKRNLVATYNVALVEYKQLATHYVPADFPFIPKKYLLPEKRSSAIVEFLWKENKRDGV